MQMRFDATAGALYVSLRPLAEGEHAARTLEIGPGTLVDEDDGGRILGIEVLDPGRSWPLPQILRRWEISDEDQVLLLGAYPCGVAVSVT